MLIDFNFLLYSIAIVIYAINYFKKKFDVNLKYFLAYLVSMLFFEILAVFLKPFTPETNLWVYNILTFVEFNCLLLFINGILSSKLSKRFLNYFIILFNIIYFSSSLYYAYEENYILTYNSISSILGSFLVTGAVFLFFKDFINSDRILNFKKSLPFWISVGLLVYYLGSIPGTLTLNAIKHLKRANLTFIINITPFLSLIMYCIFIFGALWSQKKEL